VEEWELPEVHCTKHDGEGGGAMVGRWADGGPQGEGKSFSKQAIAPPSDSQSSSAVRLRVVVSSDE